MDFSEIDQFGSDRSTGDFCLRDTGEGGVGQYSQRANRVSKNCLPVVDKFNTATYAWSLCTVDIKRID